MKFLDFICIQFIIFANLDYFNSLAAFKESGGNIFLRQIIFNLIVMLCIAGFRLYQVHHEAKIFCMEISEEDKKQLIERLNKKRRMTMKSQTEKRNEKNRWKYVYLERLEQLKKDEIITTSQYNEGMRLAGFDLTEDRSRHDTPAEEYNKLVGFDFELNSKDEEDEFLDEFLDGIIKLNAK